MPEPMQASDCSAVVGHLPAWPLEADGWIIVLAHPGIIGKGATHISQSVSVGWETSFLFL